MLSYTSLLHPTTQAAIASALQELVYCNLRSIGVELASGSKIVIFKRPLCGFEYLYHGPKGCYNVTEQVKRALKMQKELPIIDYTPAIQADEHIELQSTTKAIFEPLAEYRPQWWGKETQKASHFEWDIVEFCR